MTERELELGLGLENSNIDNANDFYNIEGEWENPEINSIYFLCINFLFGLCLGIVGYFLDIKEIQLQNSYSWLIELSKILIIVLLFFHGYMRYKFQNIQVQYTRKIFHVITQFILPLLAYKTYQDRKNKADENGFNLLYYSLYECIWSSFFINLGIILMCKPIRKLDNFLGYFTRISFLAIDRLEDRPYTLLWLILQISAVSCVETPMTLWFISKGKFHLFWIPIFASGLGDGLAEIVGKKWGKHKYYIYSLCSDRKYTRSVEGSLCVWFFTLVGTLIGYNYYNTKQLIFSLSVIPTLTTIVEAISPHTFDNHFIFGIIWLNLWFIFDIL